MLSELLGVPCSSMCSCGLGGWVGWAFNNLKQLFALMSVLQVFSYIFGVNFRQSISLTCSDMYVQSLWYLVMFRHVHSLSLLVETTT